MFVLTGFSFEVMSQSRRFFACSGLLAVSRLSFRVVCGLRCSALAWYCWAPIYDRVRRRARAGGVKSQQIVLGASRRSRRDFRHLFWDGIAGIGVFSGMGPRWQEQHESTSLAKGLLPDEYTRWIQGGPRTQLNVARAQFVGTSLQLAWLGMPFAGRAEVQIGRRTDTWLAANQARTIGLLAIGARETASD